MSKILLTGATGFIGATLLSRLKSQHKVSCLLAPRSINPYGASKDVHVESCDLKNQEEIKRVVGKLSPNIVIHLGAISPVRYSFEHPEIYQQTNLLGTIYLAQAALQNSSLEKFIYASTMEVYGWQPRKKPFAEKLALNPGSPYAVSKSAAENYIRMLGMSSKFPYLIARCCNTFGRKDDTGYLIEYLVTQMLQNRTPEIGTPRAVRDLMYIDDHIGAYLSLVKYKLPDEDERMRLLRRNPTEFVFNFGKGSEFTMMQVAKKIATMVGFRGAIKTGFPRDYPSRPFVEEYLSLDAKKAKKHVNWEPRVTLKEGLERTIEHWRTNLTTNKGEIG